MAQLIDDCFAFGVRLIPLREATALIRTPVACAVVAEAVSLVDAGGRVLAEDGLGRSATAIALWSPAF